MDTAAALASLPVDEPRLQLVDADPEQLFVSQLRSSATHFAAA